MTVGSIVHELLQLVLRRKLKTLEEIRAVSDEMMSDPQMAFTLYASQMASNEARAEIDKFLDKIHVFVDRFVEGFVDPAAKVRMGEINRVRWKRFFKGTNCTFQKDNNFDGQIDSIQDIEENIWVPKLGLKGKVDVSVNVRATKSRCKSTVEHFQITFY